MTRLPFAAKQEDVQIKLAEVLHKPPFPTNPPVNFEVVIFPKHNDQGRVGILTLPDKDVAQDFLRSYGSSGVAVKGRCINFKRSNKPLNDAKVARLISTPWQDPRQLLLEKEMRESESRPSPLTQFSFGRFLRDGKFVSTFAIEGNAEVACDLERRQVRLTIREQHRDSLLGVDISSIFSALDISMLDTCIAASYPPARLQAVLDDHEAESPVVFLQAIAFPNFTSEMTESSGLVKMSRLQGLIPNQPMPHGCYSLMCTFKHENHRRSFIGTCEKRLRVKYIRRTNIRVIQGDSSHNIASVTPLLARLSFEVAFEVEKAIINEHISFSDALSLRDPLLSLSRAHPDHVAAIFRKMIARLEEDKSSDHKSSDQRPPASARLEEENNSGWRRPRRSRRRRRRQGTSSIAERLTEATKDYLDQLQRPRGRLAPSNTTTSYTYHMVLTPTRYILEGPSADQSNSVLRRFGKNEYFLRVAFQDETRSKLRGDFETSINQLLSKRYRPALKGGFLVAGRKFELLGYSMSGLKEHSMWFVTPFRDTEGQKWNAETIRGSLVGVPPFFWSIHVLDWS